MNLTDKRELISYLKSHGLYTKHSLGQNFLIDKNALDKIIAAADIERDDLIIEVGPGLGVLTQELVAQAGKVIAIEKDERLAELLPSVISSDPTRQAQGRQGESRNLLEDFSDLDQSRGRNDKIGGDKSRSRNDQLEVINADILRVNIPELTCGKPYKVVANIPYYITSKILRLFLESPHPPEAIVMLVQKEVAERICAKPGDLSVLAISIQTFGEPEIVEIVPRGSFFPAPEVDSAILRIKNIHPFKPLLNLPLEKGEQEGVDEKAFFRLVHIGFASKRKTLLNNLSSALKIDKSQIIAIIEKSNLSPQVRAQDLSIQDWVNLTKALNI